MKALKTECPHCAGTGKIPRGEHLRDLRKALGLTLEYMAQRAGVSHQYLSQIERGQVPATPAIRRAYGEL